MTKPAQAYTRLTRNVAGLGSYSSLWLAADHLMVVRSTGYHETYSRLQLSDVRGILLTAGSRRVWWGLGWAALASASGMVVATALVAGRTPIVSAVFLAIFTGAFIWNQAMGPGCRAFFLTGVQTAELGSLVRMRKARRVVAQLQPLIAIAQAHRTPASAASETPVIAADSVTPPPPLVTPEINPPGGR